MYVKERKNILTYNNIQRKYLIHGEISKDCKQSCSNIDKGININIKFLQSNYLHQFWYYEGNNLVNW